jgi:hypothetical protein
LRAKALHKLQPVHIGQRKIEQNTIWPDGMAKVQSVRAEFSLDNGQTRHVLQVNSVKRPVGGVIFDNQKLGLTRIHVVRIMTDEFRIPLPLMNIISEAGHSRQIFDTFVVFLCTFIWPIESFELEQRK